MESKEDVARNEGVIQIAIDGPAVSGKGTVARLLAKRIGFLCLDTGALYRGMTISLMDGGVDLDDVEAVKAAIGSVDLHVELCDDALTHVFLGSVDVTQRLHDLDVCQNVYRVALIPAVRAHVKRSQHDVGCCQNIVCEGRDIGSVVFPEAQFKFYLTATLKARSIRRFLMEQEKGNAAATMESVTAMIRSRDRMDKTRPISPLVRAPGAVVIDASVIRPDEVVDKMIRRIRRTLHGMGRTDICPKGC